MQITGILTKSISLPGDYTDGKRKLCYSYDAGVTFADTGFTVGVVSPKAKAAFPVQLSLSASRKVSVFGEAITQGDKVKIVRRGSTCYGTSDTEDIGEDPDTKSSISHQHACTICDLVDARECSRGMNGWMWMGITHRCTASPYLVSTICLTYTSSCLTPAFLLPIQSSKA